MSRAVYLDQTDARDIRNLNELLSDPKTRKLFCEDPHSQAELWAFFRHLTVRLDKAGNKTKPWQRVRKRRAAKQA